MREHRHKAPGTRIRHLWPKWFPSGSTGWSRWLDTHWVTPAYGGWVLLGITLSFLGAATNTMAGWLYVISGVTMALLSVASILPQRALRGLVVTRQRPYPVSAGDSLSMVVSLENTTAHSKHLLQLQDTIPTTLGGGQSCAIATLSGNTHHTWRYTIPTERRGIYSWSVMRLRTAAPLGLFWCNRDHTTKTTAIVYPTILSLDRCPIIDRLGDATTQQLLAQTPVNASGTEGLTRALRPYRWGDPTRLVHWRTSARYGELRVRELEVFTGRQQLLIALDTAQRTAQTTQTTGQHGEWTPDSFEQAVITAASLYHYGQQHGLSPQLWTANTGLLSDRIAILTRLAGVQLGEPGDQPLPSMALLWLTANVGQALPHHSLEIVFRSKTAAHSSPSVPVSDRQVQIIDPTEDLQRQLQQLAV